MFTKFSTILSENCDIIGTGRVKLWNYICAIRDVGLHWCSIC